MLTFAYCFLVFNAVSLWTVSSTPVPVPVVPVVADHVLHPQGPVLHLEPVAPLVPEPARIQRSPKPIFGLLHSGLKSHHHHHRPHHGHGDYYGGGGFSGSGAQASAFSGSGYGGHGGGGSNSHAAASSNSLSFNTPFGGISASSSFAQSNSNSFGNNGYDW